MFRAIRNSNLAYYIYSAFVLLLGAGALVFFYFMVTGFNVGVYQENTLVGNVYIGGLDEDEATNKVTRRIGEWYGDDTVNFDIAYDGYQYTVDRDIFSFDAEASMQNISEGGRNEMMVSMSDSERDALIDDVMNEPFMDEFDASQFDFDALIDDMLDDAASMDRFSRKHMHHYADDPDEFYDVINEINIPAVRGSDAQEIFNRMRRQTDMNVPAYEVEPFETISVLDMFGERFGEDDERFSSAELNTIGSALLDVVKDSKMFVIERHYNPQIDLERYSPYEDDDNTYPFFGRNVRVNRILGYDFRFENDAAFDYRIEFSLDGEELNAQLIGPPFADSITTEQERVEVDYVSETTENPDEVRDGQPGINILVNRIIEPADDREAFEQFVGFEYYPSLSEVVLEGDNDEENDDQ